MTYGNQFSAASLYDGGWRAADIDQLMLEYDLTAEEAEQLAEELMEMEQD